MQLTTVLARTVAICAALACIAIAVATLLSFIGSTESANHHDVRFDATSNFHPLHRSTVAPPQ